MGTRNIHATQQRFGVNVWAGNAPQISANFSGRNQYTDFLENTLIP
jgi:hypothetical protein